MNLSSLSIIGTTYPLGPVIVKYNLPDKPIPSIVSPEGL
nr:MAG TPA: hypothetical protein [Bacteriophage sp.]